MFFTRALRGNLNLPHWNRRVWEIGYSGSPLPKKKATGRPDYPVSPAQAAVLRERFDREWSVMKLLCRPNITAAAFCACSVAGLIHCRLSNYTRNVEADYFASKGVSGYAEIRNEEEAKLDAERMPGKVKRTKGSKHSVRRRANVGNLLHTHRTVEESLAELTVRNRWD